MPSEYPIIRMIRERTPGKRIPGPKIGGGGIIRPYPFDRQAQRLGQKFDAVASDVLELERGIDVSADPRAVAPERALVLELFSAVRDFERAAQALGFEWLASVAPRDDFEEEDDSDDEESAQDNQNMGVLYLTMPSQQGLRRLLAAWRRFKAGQPPTDLEQPLWSLFGFLKDLRTWSAKDRIDPSIASYVRAMLDARPDKPVKVELDLWYRTEGQRRDSAVDTLRRFVDGSGGKVLDLVEIREIRYQGALIEIPAKVARQLLDKAGDLPNLKEVMTIRPQAAFDPARPEQTLKAQVAPPPAPPSKPCIAALIDGYPVADHVLLKDRVLVVESDVSGSAVPVVRRYHGTAMCSLVLYGDLGNSGGVLDRPIAVVPVLGSTAAGEGPPDSKLAIGIIYRALQRLIEAKQADARLRNITIVNHALCDTNAPFVRRPSPWAALLDYFSHAHNLLIVASAGNIQAPFECHEFDDVTALAEANQLEREAKFLVAIERSKGTRSIYSPAEAVNALTIGAVHDDAAPDAGPGEVDPFRRGRMTNIASAVGLGINRSVKPDLVHEGGRFLVRAVNLPGGGVKVFPMEGPNVGQLAAAPSKTGNLEHAARLSGTSNAAALITRSCIQLADSLDEALAQEQESWLAQPTRAVVLKALAAHGCSWGDVGKVLDATFPPADRKKHNARRMTISRFLGFGRANASRVLAGEPWRATLLSSDIIKPQELHEYRVPIPGAVLNNREVRRITITLAWSTPIITTIADYRGVSLDIVNQAGRRHFWNGVERGHVTQPPGRRYGEPGTLHHLILQGKVLRRTFDDPKGMFIGVQARERHPTQKSESVPYALAVTVELGQPQRASQLYVQVRDAIRNRTRTRDRVGTRR